MENAEVFQSYEEIERLYQGESIPVLSEAAQRAIREYLLENGCRNIGGVVLLEEAPSVSEARGLIEWQFQDEQNTFIGPHFLGEDLGAYSPHGVGLYAKPEQD